MSTLEEQSRILEMLERGATFGDVEEGVINHAPCDEDEKAALWLFAWSFMPVRDQRHEASQHLRQIAARKRHLAARRPFLN
jgi:hypothetical protein